MAKFAAGGKPAAKKDLGLIAMTYGNIYVARVAMGAKDEHTLKAFLEAEAYDGPALIIAYSHCIAHGINMRSAMRQQKLAVDCGHWPLIGTDRWFSWPPTNRNSSWILTAPSIPLKTYVYNEIRYKMLVLYEAEGSAARLLALAQDDVDQRWQVSSSLSPAIAAPPRSRRGQRGKPAAMWRHRRSEASC